MTANEDGAPARPSRRGTVTEHDGVRHVVLTRYLAGDPDDVWADLTQSDRLERWIGRWEGDPSTGSVTFFMTGEDPDAAGQEFTIDLCDAPVRLEGRTGSEDSWRIWFELVPDEDVTVLTFGQVLSVGDDAGSIGPGWEYYLDRLLAVRAGRPATSVSWDDYYPVLRSAYS